MKTKNKRGFTLIELLAVIVVLAIIALIATPIVMKTIKNAKKGAAERSADSYIKQVETTVATERLEGNVLEGEYTIQSDGDICPVAGCGDNDENKVKIAVSGNKPKSGTIKIESGQVTLTSTMDIGGCNVTYDSTNKKYVASEKGSTPAVEVLCTKKDGVDLSNLTYGNEFTCHLDSDRTFYVLETNGDNVSLIMDRNFTDDTVLKELAWCMADGDDNTTCKSINSEEEGTPLKHIQDTFGANVKVSFPTASQIATASGKTLNNPDTISGLAIWLYDYLNNEDDSVSEAGAYWTASRNDDDSTRAWKVDRSGTMDNSETYVGDGTATGVRPVITIQKSQLG